MSHFKIGEVGIHRPGPGTNPELMCLDGEEVEVIGSLTSRFLVDGPYYCYEVRHPIAGEFYCAPHELQRPKPPASDTGERLIATLIRETLDKAPQRVGETV